MIHETLDEHAYEEGDWDKKQCQWFGKRLHMDQDIDNPTY